MIEILIFGAIAAIFAAKKNAVDTKQAVISAVKQEPKPTPEPVKKSDLGIETPVFTPTPPPLIKEEPEEKTTGKTFFDTPEETKQEPIPAPKPEQPVIFPIFDDPVQIKPEKPAFFEETPVFVKPAKPATNVNPLLHLWTPHTGPFENWGFYDLYTDVDAANIPDFRKSRVQVFLSWLLNNHQILPYNDWEKVTRSPGNVLNFANQYKFLRTDPRIKKYCLENGINLETEIYKFEQAGGFGTTDLKETIPQQICFGGSFLNYDDAFGTGWQNFGIDYPAETKAKFAAYEIDLKFKYGSIKAYTDSKKKAIYELFAIEKPNLQPVNGIELTAINRTITPQIIKFDPQAQFLAILQKMPNFNNWSKGRQLFAVEYTSYKKQGHNLYFSTKFPDYFDLVKVKTKEEKKADQEAYNAWLAAELAKKEAAAAEAAKITGVTIDKALEVINKFAAVPLRATGPGANDANKRIQRFMDVQIQQYGTEGAYTRYLKANGKSFWSEMLAYESANGLTWTENPRYVIDAETGQGTTLKQAQSNYFAARVPSSQMILGRFYVSEAGKCYIKDPAGQILYNPIIYGDTLENGKYQLQTDAKGTFYTLK